MIAMGKPLPLRRIFELVVISALIVCSAVTAWAGDLRITIPRHSQLTPVQRLNREGVEAVNKQQYEKARELFFKAYLYDPGDPFTLNNLGYVAELEGQVERAHEFYSLAAAQATDALIDRSSVSNLEGQSVQSAISQIRDIPMQVNRANVEAVRLLSEGRIREADEHLRRALALDPGNPFTLNNLGVASEAQGEYALALRYYDQAAGAPVEDPIVVTTATAWRGRRLNDLAKQSAENLRSMKSFESNEAKVALLNLRGVSAMNRNDWAAAWEDFSQAFRLGPTNAFSLNNQGFMAEMNGDLESANEFYREARNAFNANNRIGLASRPDAEGLPLFSVADDSRGKVSSLIESVSDERKHKQGPILLKRRDGTTVAPFDTATPPATNPQ